MPALEQLLAEHERLSERFREVNTVGNGAIGFSQQISKRLHDLETAIATIARPCTHELAKDETSE